MRPNLNTILETIWSVEQAAGRGVRVPPVPAKWNNSLSGRILLTERYCVQFQFVPKFFIIQLQEF